MCSAQVITKHREMSRANDGPLIKEIQRVIPDVRLVLGTTGEERVSGERPMEIYIVDYTVAFRLPLFKSMYHLITENDVP